MIFLFSFLWMYLLCLFHFLRPEFLHLGYYITHPMYHIFLFRILWSIWYVSRILRPSSNIIHYHLRPSYHLIPYITPSILLFRKSYTMIVFPGFHCILQFLFGSLWDRKKKFNDIVDFIFLNSIHFDVNRLILWTCIQQMDPQSRYILFSMLF